jgi:hypothetical protein
MTPHGLASRSLLAGRLDKTANAYVVEIATRFQSIACSQ